MLRHPNDELLIQRRREQINRLENHVKNLEARCIELARELGPEREHEEVQHMVDYYVLGRER